MFLNDNTTDDKFITACALNHISFFAATSEAHHGKSFTTKGCDWYGSTDEVVIPFPNWTSEYAASALDEVLEYCLEVRPAKTSCWSLIPYEPADLGLMLMARGFEWGWQPHWMVLDMKDLETFQSVQNLVITVDTTGIPGAAELPYYKRENAGYQHHILNRQPVDTWRLIGSIDGQVVAHATVHLSSGELGVAGIYSVGVVETARRQGIGQAITLAAALHGKAQGCRYAVLNAANPFYLKFGFRSLGYGQTWWIHDNSWEHPATQQQITFAEAVARGDLSLLDTMEAEPELMTDELPCGLTPLELAARFSVETTGKWLLEHGAHPAILPLWDLKMHSLLEAHLHENPQLVNEKCGPWALTALHSAIWRNDLPLVRLLLTAKPDLSIKDAQFNSTPVGWARHFSRTKILKLLEEYEA